MAYGVTPEGFARPRLPEIRQEIIANIKSRLRAAGLSDNIQTRPDSVFGLVIDTFAERETALWEMGEGVYYAMYPGSATGMALDRAVSFSGARRGLPERSQAYVIAYGVQGTVIAENSQLRNSASQILWQTREPVTISTSSAADVSVVPVVNPGETYTVTIDGVNYSYVSGAFDTLPEILAGLVSVLNVTDHDVSSNGAAVRVIVVNKTGASFSLSSNLSFSTVGSRVTAETLDYVADAAQPGDLNAIVTLTAGWNSVNNLAAASVGRESETDDELRTAYPLGVYRLGAGTLPSIGPNIRESVQGIQAIKVYQNTSDSVDSEGRLPHSVHLVVDGGIEAEIAEAMYRVIGAGIDTNGDVVHILDTPEGEQTYRFDRPQKVYVWVKALVTLLPATESPFPPDGFSRITQAIETTGKAHAISQDVISQRFFCGIYETPGIDYVDLSFAHSTDPGFVPDAGDFSADNIVIATNERAIFDLSRIEVTG